MRTPTHAIDSTRTRTRTTVAPRTRSPSGRRRRRPPASRCAPPRHARGTGATHTTRAAAPARRPSAPSPTRRRMAAMPKCSLIVLDPTTSHDLYAAARHRGAHSSGQGPLPDEPGAANGAEGANSEAKAWCRQRKRCSGQRGHVAAFERERARNVVPAGSGRRPAAVEHTVEPARARSRARPSRRQPNERVARPAAPTGEKNSVRCGRPR